jgi:heat shock transcription factor
LKKLWQMCCEETGGGTIAWDVTGQSIVIKSHALFEATVMPHFFASKDNKFSSFQRQLNNFGFRRTHGQVISYRNALFQRDAPAKVMMIKRKIKRAPLKVVRRHWADVGSEQEQQAAAGREAGWTGQLVCQPW